MQSSISIVLVRKLFVVLRYEISDRGAWCLVTLDILWSVWGIYDDLIYLAATCSEGNRMHLPNHSHSLFNFSRSLNSFDAFSSSKGCIFFNSLNRFSSFLIIPSKSRSGVEKSIFCLYDTFLRRMTSWRLSLYSIFFACWWTWGYICQIRGNIPLVISILLSISSCLLSS